MDWVREGLYFRGNYERQRQNYGKAYDAFQAAGNYRDSLFKLALVMLEASQSPVKVIEHLEVAFDAGQLSALPWLYVLINQQNEKHPRADEIEQIFERLRHEKHPTIIGQMGQIQLKGKSYDEALIYFKEAALSGDVESKQILGEILSDRAWWSEIYNCMLEGNVFNFEGFPYKPILDPIGEIDPIYRDESNYIISDELFKLIDWLYTQGPVELRHYRSLFTQYKTNIQVKKLSAVAEYDEKFKSSFGYAGSVAEDVELIMVFANDLLQCSRKPDLGLFEFLMSRFGAKDLFEEMVSGVMASESKKQVDATFMQMTSYFYKSDFSLSKAMLEIPIDYSLPSVKKFLECCERLDFDSAEVVFSELIDSAKLKNADSIHELVNLFEFVERSKYEFDFLPTKLLKGISSQIFFLINSDDSSEIRRSLGSFRPNGERPYYLDDIELILENQEN